MRSDFNWSSICTREDERTTHLSFGDGFFFSFSEFFFSSSSSGFYCSQMRTTCMDREPTSLKATNLQMANEDQNQGAAQPMVLGVLNPSRVNGSLWFKRDSLITNEIRTIIRSDFPGPYRNWSTTPLHVKNRWWFTFKSKFSWNHVIESEVRKMFCKCAATKLIDMMSRVKERGKQPYWILDDYYKDLVAYWGTDKAKDRSKKASKSRMSDRNGLGPHKHRAGSRSYARVADILKEKNGDASYIDVLRETHKKSDGSFVDERARLISEGFEKNVADHMLDDDILSAEELTPEQKNEMYLKLVDSTQGRVFGLGALLSELSINAKLPFNTESNLVNDEIFQKKVQEISEENADIKERLSKLEGLEKMIAILCPAILSTRVSN